MKYTLYIKTYVPNVNEIVVSTSDDLYTLFKNVDYDAVDIESFYVLEYPSGKIYYA